jgi:hypothetical protein
VHGRSAAALRQRRLLLRPCAAAGLLHAIVATLLLLLNIVADYVDLLPLPLLRLLNQLVVVIIVTATTRGRLQQQWGPKPLRALALLNLEPRNRRLEPAPPLLLLRLRRRQGGVARRPELRRLWGLPRWRRRGGMPEQLPRRGRSGVLAQRQPLRRRGGGAEALLRAGRDDPAAWRHSRCGCRSGERSGTESRRSLARSWRCGRCRYGSGALGLRGRGGSGRRWAALAAATGRLRGNAARRGPSPAGIQPRKLGLEWLQLRQAPATRRARCHKSVA